LVKKFTLLILLTLRAQTEETDLVMAEAEPGLCGHFLGQLHERGAFRIDDAPAGGADGVGVGIGFVAVIAAAQVGETQLQDLLFSLQHIDGVIDRGQTGGGEMDFDHFKDSLNARVAGAVGQDFENGQSLGGEAVPFVLEHLHHLVIADVGVGHAVTPKPVFGFQFSVKNNMKN